MTPTQFLGLSREKAVNQAGTATRSLVDRHLAWSIALAAASGGLIHLKASVDHRHLAVVAIGFAGMGASQWLFAGTMFVRPSRRSLAWGAALHAAILLTWILSRTIGLPFIPGAERPAPVGVADLVANTFSVAVAVTAIVAMAIHRSDHLAGLGPRVIRAIKALVVVGVLILTIPALAETHDHDQHEAVAPRPAAGHHDSDPVESTTHLHNDTTTQPESGAG